MERTRQDYAAFVVYCVLPASLPLAVIWAFQGLGGDAFIELSSGGAFYLIAIAASSTLLHKTVTAMRFDERHGAHMLVFIVLLAACIGFGLHYALDIEGLDADGPLAGFEENSLWVSIVLLIVAVLPIGLNTCRVTSRPQDRTDRGRRHGDKGEGTAPDIDLAGDESQSERQAEVSVGEAGSAD